MLSAALLALVPLLALSPVSALDNNGMRQRSVYQVVTDRFGLADNSTSKTCTDSAAAYCGGTWKGIQNRLDYISAMGFDTVWISPVVSNIGGTTPQGQAYHGYWTLDPSTLNSNFGSAADLSALAAALHARGMFLMVDVVVNHVAATSSGDFKPSSAYGPFSNANQYHPFCWITDYTNQTQVEQCWLGNSEVALPDLNTDSQGVQDYWNGWMKSLVSNYTVDAVRIDTVKHISQSFWPNFVQSAGVANVGEVLDADPAYVGAYQTKAQVNPFNYPVYWRLARAFNTTSGSMTDLRDIVAQVKGNFSDVSLVGNFLNNHDNPRFESWQSDQALIRNAHTFPFISDGVPYLYYGSEQGFTGGADPLNREAMWKSGYATTDRYKDFARLNHARQAAAATSSSFYTSSSNITVLSAHEILVSKPPLLSLLTNRGSQDSSEPTYYLNAPSHNYEPNTVLLDVMSCSNVTTASNGTLAISNAAGMPRVLIPYAQRGSACSETFATNSSSGGSGGGSGGGKSAADRSAVVGITAGLLSVGAAIAHLAL